MTSHLDGAGSTRRRPTVAKTEMCPFCGKTYKRLKSHLPHCKAAASSKTPSRKQDVTVNQTATSAQLAESTETLSVTASLKTKKGKKTAAAATQSSASPPPSGKKKKTKLPEQIKEASMSSSSTASLISPTASRRKKQSLSALIEAAESEQGTRAASEEQHSSSAPFVADPLPSRTTADSVQDNAPLAFLSTNTKPKAATRPKVKKSIPTAKDASLHPQVDKSSESPPIRGDLWVDMDLEIQDLKMKTVRDVQPRVIVQDVRATLGRAKDARKSSRPSILSRIQTDPQISPVPLPAEKQDGCLVATTTQQQTALQPVTGNSLRSRQASLIPLQQLELTSPAAAAPLLPGPPSPQVGGAVSVNEGPKGTGLLTISPSLAKFSSPLPGARAELLRAEGGSKTQLEIRTQNTASEKAAGAPTQRSLGQVRLRELPDWLACRTPTHPKQVVELVQKGWQWYNKRYIDVRKGGVGGLSMLLAGYCVLSYIWSYPHIKRDRWRKYH